MQQNFMHETYFEVNNSAWSKVKAHILLNVKFDTFFKMTENFEIINKRKLKNLYWN